MNRFYNNKQPVTFDVYVVNVAWHISRLQEVTTDKDAFAQP